MVVASATLSPPVPIPSNSPIQRPTSTVNCNSTVYLSFKNNSNEISKRSVHSRNRISYFPCRNEVMDGIMVQKHLARIEPLSGSNHTIWRMNIDILLGYLDYDFVLTEDKPADLTEKSTEQERISHAKWEKANRMAMMIVRASISDALRGYYFSLLLRSDHPQHSSILAHSCNITSAQYGRGEDAFEKDREAEDCSNKGPVCLTDHKMTRVCDTLIDVFMVDKPRTTDWRRLLAFSKEWSNIRPHFYSRCQERADAEHDPGMKHKLLRLGRKLKEVDDDIQRHDELLEVIRKASSEISEVVARRYKDFTKEFFEHVHTVAESYYDNPKEQNALMELLSTCLATVQAYDSASESIESLNAAELKFHDIINSPTLDGACKKIDMLIEKKELDSALMLMLTKAWSGAKESNMMKDEVKDILYHLYMTATGNLQKLMPTEIRILKYLLTIEDPEEQLWALRNAFTPNEEQDEKDVDGLYTTPEKLHTWIKTVVDAYHFSREGTLIREARDLMNPEIIQRLEQLKILVENNFI